MAAKAFGQRTKHEEIDGIADPYSGKSFHANDTIRQRFSFKVGTIFINGNITYVLQEDPDGDFYRSNKRFPALLLAMNVDKNNTSVPQSLKNELVSNEGERLRVAEKAIKAKTLTVADMKNLAVADINMDGQPDLSVLWEDVQNGHGSNPHYDVWININGKLCLWQAMAGAQIGDLDKKHRQLSVIKSTDKGVINWINYSVTGDTSLVSLTK